MVVVDYVAMPFVLTLAHRRVVLTVTREGAETPNLKVARLMRGDLTTVQFLVLRDGVHCSELFLASAIDGSYLLLVVDEALPRRAAARYPSISEDISLSVDLNDGSGSGVGGEPATIGAVVKVNGELAPRDVVVIERQTDGAWRIAGDLRTATGDVSLRVTGGDVYAVGIDDWGVTYQANLSVEQGAVVRPTVFIGWLYRITEPGTLPATEPQWWAAEGDNAPRLLGTARAIAVRYYQPLAHGPVPVEII